VYGPQKGASAQQVAELEAGLERWAGLVGAATGHDLTGAAGAGSAGGVGFAALSVLGAERQPGVDVVLGLIGFEDLLSGARLVITGEGSLDEQTLHGKAPAGVSSAAVAAGIPVVAVCGRNLLSDGQLRASGIVAAYSLLEIEPDPARCMADAGRLLERLAETIAADQLAASRRVGQR
jgi:glycerate kinase